MHMHWSYIFFLVGVVLQNCYVEAGLSFGSKESGINLIGGKLSVSNSLQGWDGTLTTSSERNVTSGQINFNGGRFLVNNVPSTIYGRLQSTANSRLQLLGSQKMRIEAGPLSSRLYVSGVNNRFEGQPIFDNDTIAAPNITIDTGGVLILAMQSVCNAFISLSSSSLILDDDLKLADNKQIFGSGCVSGNNKTVSFGGTDMVMTGTLSFLGPAAVDFKANSRLSAPWKIGTTDLSQQININGNGNMLDLTLGGTLSIGPGVKLGLSNMKIKGFGGKNGGGIAFGSPTSQLRLSNVQLELTSNYTVTMGNIYVDGPTTVITKDKMLTFSNNATLSVNGVTLWYDGAGYPDQNNIKPARLFTTNGADRHFGLINGGAICFSGGVFSPTITYTTLVTTDTTIRSDFNVTVTKKLVFTDNSVLDGSGSTITFSHDDNIVQIASNKNVVFKNVRLDGLSPQSMPLLKGQGVLFGDDTFIKIVATKTDIARGSIVLDKCWFFGGKTNMVVDGDGNTLDISLNPNAMSLVSSGTLTLQNMKIYGLGGTPSVDHLSGFSPFVQLQNFGGYDEMIVDIVELSNLRTLHRHGTINFKNVELILTGDYRFGRGYLGILQDVLMRGVGSRFTYRSPSALTIGDSAILTMDYGLTFSYDSRDPGSLKSQHLKFASDSSILYLDGATLHATRAGLQISRGTIFVNNAVTLSSEGDSLSNGMVVAPRVNVHVLAAATLNLAGKVVLQ